MLLKTQTFQENYINSSSYLFVKSINLSREEMVKCSKMLTFEEFSEGYRGFFRLLLQLLCKSDFISKWKVLYLVRAR